MPSTLFTKFNTPAPVGLRPGGKTTSGQGSSKGFLSSLSGAGSAISDTLGGLLQDPFATAAGLANFEAVRKGKPAPFSATGGASAANLQAQAAAQVQALQQNFLGDLLKKFSSRDLRDAAESAAIDVRLQDYRDRLTEFGGRVVAGAQNNFAPIALVAAGAAGIYLIAKKGRRR